MNLPPAPSLLDESHLAVIADIAFDDFKEILLEMIDEAPQLLNRIETELSNGELERAADAAHSFRGMLLNFGCPALAGRLLQIEKGATAGGDESAGVVAGLRECWAETETALNAWMTSVSES